MPIYQYKALTSDGKSKHGVVDAETPKEARTKLRKQGLMVTEISAARQSSGGEAADSRVRIRIKNPLSGRNLAELAMVTRQMATMLSTGMTVTDSLEAIIKQIQGTRYEGIFRGVREKITQGQSFGGALSSFPSHFSDIYVNMVRAGEAAGTLDLVLLRLAEYLRNQHRIRAKIQAALTYPAIMLFVGFGVVAFLMSYVVPNITQLVIQQGGEKALPMPTRLLITISHLFTGEALGFENAGLFWLCLLPVLVGLSIGWRALLATDKGRRTWDSSIFHIPILGDLFKKQAVSRFATTFATLLKSGVPAAEALRIVQRVVSNRLVEDTIGQVHDRIMEGADIAAPLQKSKVFPPVVGYMIAIGEQAGKLDEVLEKLSESYDEEIEITTQKVISLIEPIMIVVMAVVVGFIVLSIILPILQVTKAARGG